MVKGRRKSRSKSSGDFSAIDCDDRDDDSGTWCRVNIAGEVGIVCCCTITCLHCRCPCWSHGLSRVQSRTVEQLRITLAHAILSSVPVCNTRHLNLQHRSATGTAWSGAYHVMQNRESLFLTLFLTKPHNDHSCSGVDKTHYTMDSRKSIQ